MPAITHRIQKFTVIHVVRFGCVAGGGSRGIDVV